MALLERALLVDGSFAGMLSRYGFGFEEKGGSNYGYYEILDDAERMLLVNRPLYFSRSGFLRLQESVMYDIGARGSVRSKSAKEDLDNAFYYTVNMGNAMPTDYSQRYYGFSLRGLGVTVIFFVGEEQLQWR